MHRWLWLGLGTLLLLSGCSRPSPSPLQQNKSCAALLYEEKATETSLEEVRQMPDFQRNIWDWVHYGVVAAGIYMTLQPQWLYTRDVWIPLAGTIGYYNGTVRENDKAERLEKLESQQVMLKKLIEEKECRN